MQKINVQRNELYKKVWSKPVSRLSEELGISSHRLYKVCNERNIPTPSAGYWAKLRHNKKVKKPDLPDSENKTFTLIISEKTSTYNEIPKKAKTISVANRLTRPHSLIKQARDDIDINSLNRFNRVRGGCPLDIRFKSI
jgi:hypothetical protein